MDDFFTPDIKKQQKDDFFTPDADGSVLKSDKPENNSPPAFGGRNLLATGVRVGSGILSGEGGLPGALISGAGEAAAGLIEGPNKEDITPSTPRLNETPTHAAFRGFLEGTVAPIKRIGVEAGFGAIPFGKVVKGGEVLKSAARSGAIGAAHTAISKGVEGKPITGGDLALSGTLGALLGGGFAYHGTPKPTSFEVEPTLHTGEGASAAEFNKSGKVVNRTPSTAPPSSTSHTGQINFKEIGPTPSHYDTPYGHGEVPTLPEEAPRLPGDRYLSPEDQTRQILRDQKNLRDVEKWAQKQADDQEAQDQINEALGAGDLQGKTTVREGYKSGPFSVSTTYKHGGKPPASGGNAPIVEPDITPPPSPDVPPDNRQPQIDSAIDRLSEILGVKKPDTSTSGLSKYLSPEEMASLKPNGDGIFTFKDKNGYDRFVDGEGRALIRQPQLREAPKVNLTNNVVPISENLPLGEVNVKTDPLTQSPLGRTLAPPSSPESVAAAKEAAALERAPVEKAKRDTSARKAREKFKTVQGFKAGLDKNIEAGGLPPEASAPSVEAPEVPSIPGDKYSNYPASFLKAPGGYQYPPEALAELDRLGTAYSEGDKSAGKAMAEIRDFFTPGKMREKWKGAPEVSPTPTPEEGSIADQVAARAAEPNVESTTPEPSGFEPNPQGKEMSPEEVQQELNWIQRLSKLAGPEGSGGEKGAIDPKLLFGLAKTLGGAALGAPTGAALYPEHPIRGALGGGIVGGALAGGGMKSLIENRDAGLLLGPAMIKKHLSDLGTIGLTAGEKLGQSLTGDTESARQGVGLLRELLRIPTNAANYGKALKTPALARDVLGQSAHLSEATMPESPFLRQVIRGYTAPQYATTEIFRRAGVPEKEAFEALNMADPKTDVGKWWAKMQGNKYVKLLRPFARYATNLAEGGLQRIPGVALIPKLDKAVGGDPNTKIGRTILGSLTTGGGVLQGMKDQQDEELGTKTAHPFLQAWLARYLPNFVMGEALSHAPALRELRKIYVPAVGTSIPDVQATGENADTYPTMAKKFIDLLMEQTLPDILNPAEKQGQAR